MDLFPTILKLAGMDTPEDRTVDGRNLWPLLLSGDAPSQHEFLVSMHRNRLMAVHSGNWKLHVLPPPADRRLKDPESWVDRRGPDGLTIIAPWEQSTPLDYPGSREGVAARESMLFNLKEDPGETTDLSAQHPEVVDRLGKFASDIHSEFPELPLPKVGVFEIVPGGRFDFWNDPTYQSSASGQ
jgi:arylsulfatase A-like enzyme